MNASDFVAQSVSRCVIISLGLGVFSQAGHTRIYHNRIPEHSTTDHSQNLEDLEASNKIKKKEFILKFLCIVINIL